MDTNCNTDCEPLGEESNGVNLVVAQVTGGDDCVRAITQGDDNPSIPISTSSTNSQLYDGSSTDQINLPLDDAPKIHKILISVGDQGSIKGFKPPFVRGTYKLVSKGGSVSLVPFKFPSLLPDSLDFQPTAEHVLGARKVTPVCAGSTKQFPYEFFKIATGEEPLPAIAAVDDTATTAVETPENIDVLANDTVTTPTVTIATPPANGTAEVELDGTITYTPDEGFCGDDTFDYTITDAALQTSTATVTVTVTCPAITAIDDTGETDFETPLNIDVAANDTGTGISVTAVSDPANGTATIEMDGTVTYTPDADFDGADSFTYTITDDYGQIDTATVSVTVNPQVGEPECFDGVIAFHYDASTLTGADNEALASWPDLSGNSYDLVQASGTKQPLLKTAARNGLNVVQFDGSNDSLVSPTFLSSGAESTVFCVMKWDADQSGAVFSKRAGNSANRYQRIQFVQTGPTINVSSGELLSSPAYSEVSNWALIRLDVTGSPVFPETREYIMKINGATILDDTSYIGFSDVAPNSSLYVGCRNTGFGEEVFFKGQIGEIVVINQQDTECSDLWEEHLKTKWGFTY